MSGIGISISVSVNGSRKVSPSPAVLNNVRSESNIDLITEGGIDIISE